MEKTVQHMHQMIDAFQQIIDTGEPFERSIALGALKTTEQALQSGAKTLHDLGLREGKDIGFVDDLVTAESLHELAAIATEFDKSGEPLLMKQAAVLDEILLTIGAQKGAVEQIRRKYENEIAKIKGEQNKFDLESKSAYEPAVDLYHSVKPIHDKQNGAEEAAKAIKDIKLYRPLEAPMSTRTCVDHPGQQLMRIGDNVWQCSLDGKSYNYNDGFTTMRGNKVPGGSVANQTSSMFDSPSEFCSFDSRESRLNQ